jgi:hypothetical protein
MASWIENTKTPPLRAAMPIRLRLAAFGHAVWAQATRRALPETAEIDRETADYFAA